MGIYRIDFATRMRRFLIRWKKVKNAKWVNEDKFIRRAYESYEDYVSHQSAKLSLLNLSDYDEKYKSALIERYQEEKSLIAGKNLLCLGARTGSECAAFIALGAFSVGIDLNPGRDNRYVLPGDFHNIQFSAGTVDIIYTNALDHSYDLVRVLEEVQRLLKPDGIFFAEVVKGDKDANGRRAGDFESFYWANCQELAHKIEGHGFLQSRCDDFSFPWHGTRFVFTKHRPKV